ncbi:MAG: methyltransferase [Phycisphaerae bacterium]|jgi:predicted O-methyltransferase YrrM|nr:methyltransferase [Phycisphaerae bacterium]
MSKHWTGDELLALARAFQIPCVLNAAAELDVFGAFGDEALTSDALAERLGADRRGMRILADALAAIELLEKDGDAYRPAAGVIETLTESGADSVIEMIRLSGNCARGWVELGAITKTGNPLDPCPASTRGAEADRESFLEAMNDISRRTADSLVAAIGPPEFKHMLDLGCGPATWTIAMLNANPDSRATLFDLPDAIPIAQRHIAAAGLEDRADFVAGNFDTDETLPGGADLAWVSAIVHQNSREQNREFFAKIHAALAGGGQILIRDVVLDPSRTSPQYGALFAVNMLVHTPAGDTFTFEELAEDLQSAGFTDTKLMHANDEMNAVVRARKTE